jgi:hypothetical protein
MEPSEKPETVSSRRAHDPERPSKARGTRALRRPGMLTAVRSIGADGLELIRPTRIVEWVS